RKRVLNNHLFIIYLLAIILVSIVCYYQWILGLVLAVCVIASFYYTFQREKRILNSTKSYISTLSHRLEKVGAEALLEMPIGIVLYNNEFEIEWINPYMNAFSEESMVVGKSLNVFSEDLIPMIKENYTEPWLSIEDYEFQTIIKKEERLLYFIDRTSQTEIQKMYFNEQTVLAVIYLDNYEEITQTMDDTIKSRLNSNITTILNDWAQEYGLYLKRTSQDRFLAIGTQEILEELEEKKFNILDIIREMNMEEQQKNPVTLSIGIGFGSVSLPDLGEIAQSSLDLALGRGGDQVAIKDGTGTVRFYGGKANPMEKRTRVRARVISHALRQLVKESDKVIIMGHK